MSTKLIKKQLGSILAPGIDKNKSTLASHSESLASKTKKRAKKSKRQQKKASKQSAAAKESQKRAHLQYFKQTTKPTSATEELFAKVLAARGVKISQPNNTQEDDFYGDDDLDDFTDLF